MRVLDSFQLRKLTLGFKHCDSVSLNVKGPRTASLAKAPQATLFLCLAAQNSHVKEIYIIGNIYQSHINLIPAYFYHISPVILPLN